MTPLEELQSRAARLQEAMREAGLDGIMATQNADLFYLSGMIQQAQVYLPAEGEPLLMVRKHPGRAQYDSALGMGWGKLEAVKSLRELPALIEEAYGIKPATIGWELDTLPVLTFQAFERALAPLGAKMVDASNLFKRVRALKSDFEIGHIRRAAKISDTIVQTAARLLREGITELELAAQLEAEARKAGHSGLQRMRVAGQEMHMGHVLSAESGALPSFMKSPQGGPGLGPWAPYGSSRRPIGRGEPVLLDFASEYGGYISDQTRTMSIGKLPQFWQDGYNAMRAVLEYLEQTIQPGMTSGQLYDLAVAKAGKLGYADNFMGPLEEVSPGQRVPFVGHGVGLELDEWPPLQRGTDAILQPGMVLAIEPKLIFARQGAIGVEDTFLVTEEGLQALTFSTRDIIET
ncbi:MAG: Xaa-Pro peptidase family protein [Chloroflexia bacterium]